MKYSYHLVKKIFILFVFSTFLSSLPAQTAQERFETAQAIARQKLKLDLFQGDKKEWPNTESGNNRNATEEEQVNATDAAESEVHAAINLVDTNNIIVSAMKFIGPDNKLEFSIYYTYDFGQSWSLSSFKGIPPTAISPIGGGDPVLLFDSQGHAHFFCLFIDQIDFINAKVQLLWAKSEDGGATWDVKPEPIAEGEISTLLFIIGELVDKEWAAYDDSPQSPFKGTTYFSYSYQDLQLTEQNYQIHLKRKLLGENEFEDMPTIIAGDEYGLVQFVSLDTDQEGTLHMLFYAQPVGESEFALFYRNSLDGGTTFSDPINISYAHVSCFPATIFTSSCKIKGVDRLWSCNSIRADDTNCPTSGNLYVVWSGDGIRSEETYGFDIYFMKSEDGGNTWSDPIVLNDDFATNDSTHNFFPALEVTSKGVVVVSWYDRREDPNNISTKYYMTYSTDGGETFVPDFPASTAASDFCKIGDRNGSFGVGEYTTIISTGGYTIPIWADGRTNDGNVDLYASFFPINSNHTLTGVEEIVPITPDFTFTSLSPNPASNQVNLNFTLKKPSKINALIFNVEGQLVRELGNTAYVQGDHQISINVSDLDTGTYSMKMQTEFGRYSSLFVVVR